MSGSLQIRDAAVLAAGLALLVFAALANFAHGESANGLADMVRAILSDRDAMLSDMALGFRAPRVVIGVLGGASLAVAGALAQSVLRNPMVSPGILGVTAGSFFVIVCATILAPALLNLAPLPLALSGGVLTTMLVYSLAGGRRATPLRVVLAGLLVGMTLSGITSALLLMHETEARYLMSWNAGLLRQNGWHGVNFAWPWILSCLTLVFLLSRQLDVARLDEQSARALGQRTGLLILVSILSVLVLTGVVVAVTGPIGFVGLVAPHLVKLAGVRRHAVLLPASAILGATLLVSADTLTHVFGTLAQAPPVGAITAAIGAPCLLWLALRESAKRGGFEINPPFGMARALRLDWVVVALVLTAMLAIAIAAACVIGGTLSLSRVLGAFAGADDRLAQRIVFDLRLPRVVVAVLAGAAFAIAGVLFQAALRNPLAESSLIGVSGGATVGVMTLVAIVPGVSGPLASLAALAGGLAAAGAVYWMAWRRGLSPTVLILVGVAVSALCGAAVQIFVYTTRFTDSPLVWLIGGLYARGWPSAQILLAALIVLAPLAWLIGRQLEMLAFDSQTAAGAGLHLTRARLAPGLIGVGLAAIAVSQTGPIGYVGLLAPHAARLLTGHRLRPQIVVAALFGALTLTLADIVARTIVSPAELPAGAVVAVIGAPYLIYLIKRSNGS